MKILGLSLVAVFSVQCLAAEYFCARSPAEPLFDAPVRVAGRGVQMDGQRYSLVSIKTHTLPNGLQTTWIRVSKSDWSWTVLCATAAQKAALDQQR